MAEMNMAFTLPDRGLATRLAGPARVFAARLGRMARPSKGGEAPIEGVKTDNLPGLHQKMPPHQALELPILPGAPEARATALAVETYVAMAEAGQWSALASALREADRARTPSPDGGRVAALIVTAAGRAIRLAMARGDHFSAEAALERLAVLAPAAKTDPAAAILLAQGHLTLAEGVRAQMSAADAPEPGILQHHIACAEALIEAFDPIEEDMPQLAALRYRQLRGMAAAKDLFRDWYEDWSDLDPGAVEPHLDHASHLLPHWFGTLGDFDAEARLAMQRTGPATGAAAYALFHLTAAEEMGRLMPGLDPELFARALSDHCCQTGCQYRANRIAGALTELAHDHEEIPGPLTAALDDHLRHGGLREIHLSGFEGGRQALDWALTRVFGAELLRGARLVATPDGLAAQFPAGSAPA